MKRNTLYVDLSMGAVAELTYIEGELVICVHDGGGYDAVWFRPTELQEKLRQPEVVRWIKEGRTGTT